MVDVRGILSLTVQNWRGRMTSPGAWVSCLFLAGFVLFGKPADAFPEDARPLFRLGVTASLISGAKENDVQAAMKAWIATVTREGNIPINTDLKIFRTADELLEFGRRQSVEGYGVILPEYDHLVRQGIDFDVAVLGVSDNRIEEEYLLLVHRDAGVGGLEALRGASLRILRSPRMGLATIWLDILLWEAGLNRATAFFGPIEWNSKVSLTALPVFFRKVDACLMTRATFEIMAELNPQLEARLRVLASSPPVVPAGFMIRAGYQSPYRPKLLEAMARLEESSGGRQILALTQMEGIEIHPVSELEESLALIEKHRQLSKLAKADETEETK
jgi:phosphonate transport system substrate-binding protein